MDGISSNWLRCCGISSNYKIDDRMLVMSFQSLSLSTETKMFGGGDGRSIDCVVSALWWLQRKREDHWRCSGCDYVQTVMLYFIVRVECLLLL